MNRTACCILTLLAGILISPAAAEMLRQRSSDAPTVDFDREIQPILEQHCIKCHGAQEQESGLRLDNRDDALKGGTSGTPLLGESVDESELFQRITSTDASYRMPLDAPPLSDEQIDTFRRWIEQGHTWPKEAEQTPINSDPLGYLFYVVLNPAFNMADYAAQHYWPLLFCCLLFFIAVLVIERAKRMHEQDHRFAVGRARWFFKLCSRRRYLYYGLVCIGLGALAFMLHIRLLGDQIAERDATIADLQGKRIVSLGVPPVPIRPNHPKRLGGTYYRGNDERKPRLFNGGHYRTATLHLSLCDAERKVLKVGDRLPEGELLVRLEIVRSPHATPTLFRKDVIESIYLTRQFRDEGEILNPDTPVPFETLTPGERWAAYYMIGSVPSTAQGALAGTVYVHYGDIHSDELVKQGKPHYGIRYDLHFKDRLLLPESELYMGAIYLSSTKIIVPKDEEIPLTEWFGFQPIPVIEGENTDDPELLGIPEHEKALKQDQVKELSE